MSVNWIDLILVLIILVSAALGWRRGFILSIRDLIRWTGSWLAALLLYKPLSHWLGLLGNWSVVWRAPIAFLILLFLAGVAIHLIGRWILARIPATVHGHPINRVLGIIPGLISGTVTPAIVSALLLAMPFSDRLSDYAQKS